MFLLANVQGFILCRIGRAMFMLGFIFILLECLHLCPDFISVGGGCFEAWVWF